MALVVAPMVMLNGPIAPGRSTFGPITPTAGVTSVQVAIDRTSLLLLTKQFDWAMELSTDGGATWTPWGGAGAPAGSALDALGGIANESSFTVSIPSANANTRLRGSLTTQELMTTTITLRQS